MSRTLFDPITLRDLTVRNRVWVPPMCQYMVEKTDGVVTPWHLMHYGSFARGGAGAVIVEATGVVPEGRISPQDLGLWNDAQRDALRGVVDLVHSLGAAAGIQLAHAGRKASTYSEWGNPAPGTSIAVADGGWETVAPSDLAFGDLTAPRALDADGIDGVIEAFVAAARRAVEAGMDMIEIHGAHGYLIHEFLSPLSNVRTDEYGGSLENRARLLLRIVDAVRASIPEGMPLLVRLSATDWVEDGLHVEDTVHVAQWLREHGVDMVDISSGGNSPAAQIPVGPGYQTPLATAVKQGAGIPVSAVGMIDEPWQAEQITATGLADVVRVGREFLRDPSFAIRTALALRVAEPPIPAPYVRAYRQQLRG
ncbi:NADH:flavin oxidoreductase/NADH oxidase [Brachybacterium sp. MASK1Z-5]|uniref:NADH:flavin oxidoreductase/NADH oxidase n=1 Tax=Brachybacterium halotolerans TaxID=2795215 RepID=A0ABS1BGD0_9MICO|nr:NADH:flavin oxidoreductase/NADH oxidase [Brachybacterium halotolerans]MBK0333085.1 NADH:flavin oxidoreductase/NADH oxidase [Brachybacterium halotolerans]